MICLFFGGREFSPKKQRGARAERGETGTEFCKQKVEVTYLEISEDESIKEKVSKSRTGN